MRKLQHARWLMMVCAGVWTAIVGTTVAAQESGEGQGEVRWSIPTRELAPNTHWGAEPVEELTEARGRIVVNGLWNIMPGMEADGYANSSWGTIRVPGSLRADVDARFPTPSVTSTGTGPAWAGRNWRQEPKFGVWYARTIRVPEEWAGRAVVLDTAWIESFADVFLDGQHCGQIRRPFGSVELTDAVKPGQEQTLMVHVRLGRPQQGYTAMGVGYVREGGSMPHRGIGLLGDVMLLSRPKQAHIADVFVQPSTRNKALGLEIELANVLQAGELQLTAEMLDEQGKIETVLTGSVAVKAAVEQIVHVDLPWENPRLWDYRQPNLYTMRLKAEGAGIKDNYWQPFGFREVWIAGRQVMLNGKPIRLSMTGPFQGATSGIPEVVDLALDAIMERGHNLVELWPEQPYQTTRWNIHQEVLARRADQMGLFFTGVMSHAVAATGARNEAAARRWDQDPAAKEEFLADTKLFIRRLRNHPSLLMWGSTGNFGMHSQDQNPRYIGQDPSWGEATSPEGDQMRRYFEAWHLQKQADPTRPVFWHASMVGDIQTINWYLNFIPLQEREEWLSHWAQTGVRPVTGVEFGLPYTYNFQRMRSYDGMGYWEILGTEHLANLLGEEAYAREGDHMWRWMLHATMKMGGQPDGVDAGAFMHHRSHLWHPDYTAYQVWYPQWVRNTWRSWRTAGMTIMPIPWGETTSDIYTGERGARFNLPAWEPGRLGSWVSDVPLGSLAKMPEGETRGRRENTTRQQALHDNNQDTLAWIAGPQDTFTVKDHSFWAGDTVNKRLVVINDTRKTQNYSFTVRVTVGDTLVHEATEAGEIEQAGTLFLPIRIALPQVPDKTDGEIAIAGTIGTWGGPREHKDTFAFRVFPKPGPLALDVPVRVWDPVGNTTELLNALGLDPQPWDGRPAEGLLIVGREALSRGKGMGDLTAVVNAGGRVLVMPQNPDWTQATLDLRTAAHLPRVVYPAMKDHPVLAGLDAQDLRDWSGVSTLVDGYPHYKHEFRPPFFGWRWGNRGALSSGPVELPHNSGWRPILTCFFEQAWSPLMELDVANGRLIWNTLDFEDYVPNDPAATMLARQLIAYAAIAPLAPRSIRTVSIGLDEAQTEIVKETTLIHEPVQTLPVEPCLVLAGRNARLADAEVERFLQSGGRIVFLAPELAGHAFGATFTVNADAGKYAPLPDWPELRGLHGGYLRTRGPVEGYLVLESGPELSANGQLGRRQVGEGVALWFMPASDKLNLPPRPWLVPNGDLRHVRRFTRIRQHQALTSILANMGAAFELDGALLRLRSLDDSITMAGMWRVKPLDLRPVNRDFGKRQPIPPASQAALEAASPQADDSAWEMVSLPQLWQTFIDHDGEAVFRRNVSIPADWAGRDLRLTLGMIRDADTVFWNGDQIGSTVGHNIERDYTIPAARVREGVNVLAVQVANNYLSGGFAADDPGEMRLYPTRGQQRIGRHPFGPWRSTAYYHFDYNESDDPFRYWRW
jgi:beta-galactosidase